MLVLLAACVRGKPSFTNNMGPVLELVNCILALILAERHGWLARIFAERLSRLLEDALDLGRGILLILTLGVRHGEGCGSMLPSSLANRWGATVMAAGSR